MQPSGRPGTSKCQLFTINRLRHSDGWSGFWGRLFQKKSIMGRLWDDHFRHLGHPAKFYRVQDAGFKDNSSSWWQICIILITTIWKTSKTHVFSPKWHYKQTKKRQGCWSHNLRVGMHQNPKFQWKSMNNWKQSGNQGQINHRNWCLFLSLINGW